MALELRRRLEPTELVRQLAEAEIRVKLRPREWGEMLERLRGGEVQFYLGGLIADSGEATDVLGSKVHSRDPERGYGDANYNGYSDPELDALIEEAESTLDAIERRDRLQACLARVAERLPLVPLYEMRDLTALDRALGWRPRLDGRLAAHEIRPPP